MSAKILDNAKVVLGQMIKVQNQNKKPTQNVNYIAIQVEDEDGNEQRCLLFTEIELSDMKQIRSKFLMDNLVAGRIYKFVIGNSNTFIMKIINRNGEQKILRINKSKLKKAQFRAYKNEQDLTKKDWLTDLLD